LFPPVVPSSYISRPSISDPPQLSTSDHTFHQYTYKYPTKAKPSIPPALIKVPLSITFPPPLDVLVAEVDASCAVNEVITSPSLAVTTTTTCAVVVLLETELVVVGVVLLVEKVVEELEVDDEDELDVVDVDDVLDEEDELLVELLSVLEDEDEDDVVEVDVDVVVGVVDVLLVVLLMLLRDVDVVVEVLDPEVVVELFVLDVKVLSLGSPLDKLTVTKTVLVSSSKPTSALIPKKSQRKEHIPDAPWATTKPTNPKNNTKTLTNMLKQSVQKQIYDPQTSNPANPAVDDTDTETNTLSPRRT